MKITLELTPEQKFFLRQFAENQKEGSIDNVGTHKPIHLVQSRVLDYIFDDGASGYDTAFFNAETQKYYDNEYELVADAVPYAKSEILTFDEAEGEEINGVFICDLQDYFKAYDINAIRVSVVESWNTVSYHFTLTEARKYIKYQGYNLVDARIYTVSQGYGNKGDYEPFWDLLMQAGMLLVNEGGNT